MKTKYPILIIIGLLIAGIIMGVLAFHSGRSFGKPKRELTEAQKAYLASWKEGT